MAALALVLFVLWFLVIFVLRAAIQKRTTGDSGVRAGVLAAPRGSMEWTAGWLLVGAVIAAPAAPILDLVGLAPMWSNTSTAVVGAGVVVIGITLTFFAQINMGRQWRVGIDPRERTDLVVHGAFKVVRNPIFTYMLFTGAGLVLIVPNWVGIIGVALMASSIQLQVRFVEEPHLRRLHGASYSAYEAQVGRFLPAIGRRRLASQ